MKCLHTNHKDSDQRRMLPQPCSFECWQFLSRQLDLLISGALICFRPPPGLGELSFPHLLPRQGSFGLVSAEWQVAEGLGHLIGSGRIAWTKRGLAEKTSEKCGFLAAGACSGSAKTATLGVSSFPASQYVGAPGSQSHSGQPYYQRSTPLACSLALPVSS